MARIAISLGLCIGLLGCELVADFDRNRVPAPSAERPDAGLAQPAATDAGSTLDAADADADAANADGAMGTP